MRVIKGLITTWLLFSCALSGAQEIPISYDLGADYSDRHKYSTILSIESPRKGQTVLVRTYYGGFPLHPKGYFIEIYDEDLNLIGDYNYKFAGEHMVDGFVKNGQLYLLELEYDYANAAYRYVVHHSSLENFNFSERILLSIPSKEVVNPLAVNKYNRSFGNGFSTATHFNDERTAFAITVQYRERRDEKYAVYLYGTDLKQRMAYDFSSEVETKNYAFENIAVSSDLETVYMMGKAYFKKRRMDAKERRFQYELVRFSAQGHTIQEFAETGRFSESLKPILLDNALKVVGFYADRKDNRYNGLAYFELDRNSLDIKSKKYNAFSQQFMKDKFGREVDTEIKNLIFKDVHITPENNILFSAEEYFVSEGEDISSGHTQITERYHYNDIVLAKLNGQGDMEWARNINKTEVTQGDASYASYTAFGRGEDMYFFINSGENPQRISSERILFKQGYSRNPNMFVIKVDASGNLSYQKLVDDKEVRLPIMVSRPYVDKVHDELYFYAKRGKRKQLIRVLVN